MQIMLVGVSAPRIPISSAAIATISNALNLRHINMRQPLVKMIAGLLDNVETNLDFCSGDSHIKELATSLAALENSLALCLRNKASDFFIKRAEIAIAEASKGVAGSLFSGQLVSGISTELEANWIRGQGGAVIHIHDYSNISMFHPLAEKDGDLIVQTGASLSTSTNNVWNAIKQIRARFGVDIEAA